MTAMHAAIAPEKKPASACKHRQHGYARLRCLSESAGWCLRRLHICRAPPRRGGQHRNGYVTLRARSSGSQDLPSAKRSSCQSIAARVSGAERRTDEPAVDNWIAGSAGSSCCGTVDIAALLAAEFRELLGLPSVTRGDRAGCRSVGKRARSTRTFARQEPTLASRVQRENPRFRLAPIGSLLALRAASSSYFSAIATDKTEQVALSCTERDYAPAMPWYDTRPWLKDPATRFTTPPDPAVLARLHDAHCHPSDDDSFTAELLRAVKTGHLVRC